MLRDDLDPPLFSTKRVRGCHASDHRVEYARDTDRSRIEPVQIPSRHCGLNIGEIERDCVGSTLPWRKSLRARAMLRQHLPCRRH